MNQPVIGIYQILNVENGKFYVGSAVNIEIRWRNHRSRLRSGTHHSVHLQRAWRKYGEEAFVFSVLEECGKQFLIEREQFYIDELTPEYNIAPKAGSTLGIKHTPETRAKMSEVKMGNKNDLGNKGALGCRRSQDTRAKISEAMKSWWAKRREENVTGLQKQP